MIGALGKAERNLAGPADPAPLQKWDDKRYACVNHTLSADRQ